VRKGSVFQAGASAIAKGDLPGAKILWKNLRQHNDAISVESKIAIAQKHTAATRP
jgi:hypothetical protein